MSVQSTLAKLSLCRSSALGGRWYRCDDCERITKLHTWNQKLESHWHVHALVPGGGPDLADGSWVTAKAPAIEGCQDDRPYLVDAINLRRSFRKFAIAHLQRLRKRGKLQYGGSLESLRSDAQWDEMINRIAGQEWVSYIEPPPTESSRAEHVVRYLTRYLTGGPISDHRILSADDQKVTFLARTGERVGGERKQMPFTLNTSEFVRRWCLHIQPDQLTKTRSWGGWSNTRAEAYREKCRTALEESSIAPLQEVSGDRERDDQWALAEPASSLSCEHCGSESLRLIERFAKPSWETLFSRGSKYSPRWYAESQQLDDIRFWDGAMGEGFSHWYEWYLKSESESARELAESIPPTQLALPGFEGAETGITFRQLF